MFLINYLRDCKIYKIELKNHSYKKLALIREELIDIQDYLRANRITEKYKNRKNTGASIKQSPYDEKEQITAYNELEKLEYKFRNKWNYSKEDINSESMLKNEESLIERKEEQKYFIDNDFEPTNKLSLIINIINTILPIFLFYISTLILLKSFLIWLLLAILLFSISLVYILLFFKIIR